MKNGRSVFDVDEDSFSDQMMGFLHEEMQDLGISVKERGSRTIFVCVASLVFNQSAAYYTALEKMENFDVDEAVKEFLLPRDVCEKIRDAGEFHRISKQNPSGYKKKKQLSPAEKEMVDAAVGRAVISYMLFEIMGLSKEEALHRIEANETNFLAKTRLNRDFDRIFKSASLETLIYCGFSKPRVVFYELYPDWYKQTQTPYPVHDLVYCDGATKAGLKMAAKAPELEEEMFKEKYPDFRNSFFEFLDSLDDKRYNTAKIDETFVICMQQIFDQSAKYSGTSLADRQAQLTWFLEEKRGRVKEETAGMLEVIENRYSSEKTRKTNFWLYLADAWYLNLPKKQIFELSDWYQKTRKMYEEPDKGDDDETRGSKLKKPDGSVRRGLREDPAMELCFEINKFLREEEGLYMEDLLKG